MVGREAVTYLRISAVGLVPLLVSLAGNGHLTGLEDTKRPFLIALVANAANVLLEIAFVYGAGLGIAGSAWGTVGAQIVSAALFVFVVRRASIRAARPRRAEVKRLVIDGIRLSIRTIALGVVLLASTALAARLGTAILAGHQIALQIWTTLALALDSLAVPAQVFVGEALGQGDPSAARRVGGRTLRFGLVGGGFVGALTIGLAWILPSIFSAEPAVHAAATPALIVCGAMQPVAALAFVLDGLLLGASDYRTLQRGMIVALLAFLPLGVAVAVDHRLGLVTVWLALACWLSARSALLGWKWARGGWAGGMGVARGR